MTVGLLLLGLGANIAGPWGSPRDTLLRARRELAGAGLCILASSRIHRTLPLGPGRQATYLNAVLLLRVRMAPAALLRVIKRIERRAGRRHGPRWGPRCLDIDILDHGSRRLGSRTSRRRQGNLVLPHPEMHLRAFVLVPLLEVAPHWHHPTLAVSARTLLARLPRADRLGIRQSLDFAGSACDKQLNQHLPRNTASEGAVVCKNRSP